MDAHFVGQDKYSEGRMPSAPTGNSMAVCQFMELARGERTVQEPSQPFRVEAVRAEERYCLGCYDGRPHDVIHGRTWNVHAACIVSICRCCGKQTNRGGQDEEE